MEISAVSSDEASDVEGRLFDTLVSIFVALTIGFILVRLQKLVPARGDMKALSIVTGEIAFPLLVFRTVAHSTLADMDFKVVIACTLGKLSVMIFTWTYTYMVYQVHRSKGQRMQTATVFAFFTTASNDFAIGFPVIQALFGDRGDAYITSNALVNSVVFTPATVVLFTLGEGVLQQSKKDGRRKRRGRQCFRATFDILMNPVITCTIAGCFYKLISKLTWLPKTVDTIVNLLTAPFGMCALFLTGASLRIPRVAFWPVLLAVMKGIVCAYASFFFGGLLLRETGIQGEELRNFVYFYGMLPSSSAPLIFAMKFDPDVEELIATATLFGLVLGGTNMFTSAFCLKKFRVDIMGPLRAFQLISSFGSIISGVFFLSSVIIFLRHWGLSCQAKQLLLAYACAAFAYAVLCVGESPRFGHSNLFNIDAPCQMYIWSSQQLFYFGAPYIFCIALLQNFLRLTLLFLMYVVEFQSYDALHQTATYACRTSLFMLTSSIVIAILPSMFTYPSTLNEICGFKMPDTALSNSKLGLNVLWSFMLLLVIGVLVGKKIIRDRSASDPAGAQALLAIAQTASWEPNVRHPRDTPWMCKPPRSAVRILVGILSFRLMLQVVNASSIYFRRIRASSGPLSKYVTGTSEQMLVLENILEHGQLVFFLVALTLDDNFLPHLSAVFSKLRSINRSSSRVTYTDTFSTAEIDVNYDSDLSPTNSPQRSRSRISGLLRRLSFNGE